MFSNVTNVFRKLFVKNIGKKIFAIAIAISIWLVVSLESNIERNITIDVNYVNLPSGLIITNEPPEDLNLVVRGPRSQLSSLSPQSIIFTVDLDHVSTGISKYNIRTDQIKPPRGIQVTGISPAEITVEVDESIRKDIAIEPIISPPEPGYEIVGNLEVVPSMATVSGPK
ncbi:MAG: hypothetical protein HY693_02165, partial [Deltaproteobacteria bacterium]|nr:hypothetical protein [Deltaproteobacteria bacterium]